MTNDQTIYTGLTGSELHHRYDCCNPHSVGQGTQTEEAGDSNDAEDEDYEEDAAIEDVVEEEPVDFADPEDDE